MCGTSQTVFIDAIGNIGIYIDELYSRCADLASGIGLFIHYLMII